MAFSDIDCVHQSFAKFNYDTITCEKKQKSGELSLSSPIFINAMTGGGGEKRYIFNEPLAYVGNIHNLLWL
ncbi:hypothetical protein CW304_15355 [Bacillus sp. UFRGS-B20]|nr:hypothetical protein CW304_15355 [Bacillus sp. UFRGS-B20]